MFDLKQRREQLGISQDEVANAVKVSRGTVSKWETGDIANMKRDKIAALSALLHVSPLTILGMDDTEPEVITPMHSYPYFDTDIAAGALTTVAGLDNAERLQLSDAVLGRYAGDKDIFVTNVSGESMNRIIPNNSLIVVKEIDNIQDLSDGKIVVFTEDGVNYSVKRFYDNPSANTITFVPDSNDTSYRPIVFRYEDMDGIRIIGRVVVYVVEL
ncbi:XRE family transcriptional regulator [Lacticaseibacillus hulanensis]|uniref:XRE family transcriptional regulator n=1 Tax=Lacticaseibacillus hulanensis TaxID=2493111 RepID=UPI000FDAB7BE|nr:XRE family transcriptional regulator [Lacticaseibacillus hulanensis]